MIDRAERILRQARRVGEEATERLDVAFPVVHRLGLHTFAWALYKNGRCVEAVPYSDRALALAPTDTGALSHRSLIERCLGDGEAAARYASRVRLLDPTFIAPSAFRLR